MACYERGTYVTRGEVTQEETSYLAAVLLLLLFLLCY